MSTARSTPTSQLPTSPGRARAGLSLLLLSAAALLSVATSASPPVIDRITPALGSSSVQVDQPLTVELERAADPRTVTSQTVRLLDSRGAVVPSTLELLESGRVILLRPVEPLHVGSDYELVLDMEGLADRDGNVYVGLRYDESRSDVWEVSGLLRVPFTTRKDLVVGRGFLVTEPEELLLYFSEEVDPRAITTSTVTLSSDAGPVNVDLRFGSETNRLRVLPLEPLDPQRQYTLSLSPSIATPIGLPLNDGAGEHLTFRLDDERIR